MLAQLHEYLFRTARPMESVQAGFGRTTTVLEDPSMRRNYPGSRITYIVHLIPMVRPEVVLTGSGPAIIHANDFSPVTAAKPAKSGEILTLIASGLGPVRPRVDPDTPFPADALRPVNSPVDVIIDARPAEVLYAGGYPGAVDRYQVNFRVPDAITTGTVILRLRVAWIEGPEVTISMQQ